MVDRAHEAKERLGRVIRWADIGEGSLRTHLDEWAAFEVGGELLTRGGRQRWLNNPCPWKEWRRLARYMDWHTKEAVTILRRGMERDPAVRRPKRGEQFQLIVEHAVPVKVIGLCVRADSALRRPERLREFLLHHFKRGVVTAAEDKLLNGAGLRESMPEGWQPGGDPFARYHAVHLPRAKIENLE